MQNAPDGYENDYTDGYEINPNQTNYRNYEEQKQYMNVNKDT